MFLKAMLGNGLFKIFDNVSNVVMSEGTQFFESPDTVHDEDIKAVAANQLPTLFQNFSKGDTAYTRMLVEHYLNSSIFLFYPNESACSRIVMFDQYNKEKGEYQHFILYTENQVYLCDDSGKTMQKW